MPKYLIIGELKRETVLLPDGKMHIDQPGGNMLYAASGLSVWDSGLGLLARVGEDYPHSWLEMLIAHGWDTRGIRVLPHAVDVRTFTAYVDGFHAQHNDPVTHFVRCNQPFPRSLLGYQNYTDQLDSKTSRQETSLQVSDIPQEYFDVRAAHFCDIDFLTQISLPVALRQGGCSVITLDPSRGAMHPAFWKDIPGLLNGLTAFLPSEEEIRALFHGRSDDLWEMAETLAGYGCNYIVITQGAGGQMLYDAASHARWEIPAYPNVVRDPTGAGDAFSGGFLAGYMRNFDPLEGVLHGNIAASLSVEGSGPFYALEALSGLARARLESLRMAVRRI